ncbi:hypothetical protein Dimus_020418 [Dionaea muscipula]
MSGVFKRINALYGATASKASKEILGVETTDSEATSDKQLGLVGTSGPLEQVGTSSSPPIMVLRSDSPPPQNIKPLPPVTEKGAEDEGSVTPRPRGEPLQGENRRRDDEDEDEAPAENVQNEEVANEGQNNQEDFDWEAVIDEVEIQREEMEKEAEIQGESGSDDKFFDAEVGVEEPADEVPAVPTFPSSPTNSSNVQQKQNTAGVNPSVSTGSLLDIDFLKLQAELDRARTARLQAELDQARVENARLLALLQQATP